jgi:mRNA interferase MazF
MYRGEIWWADLPEPAGAAPGYTRPVLIVQSDAFNRSRIETVIAVVLTSNLRLGLAPGNVLVSAAESGLPKDSVVNVSQIVTLDKDILLERVGQISERTLLQIEDGLRMVLEL